jgi:hypothetical protein
VKRVATLMVLAAWLGGACAAGNPYVEQRAAALKQCEAIDPSEYRSGLALNPDGYRSFYLRSACYQDAAVRFREERLCRQVKERWALFSSGWGYSGKRCRSLVAQGIAGDQKVLEAARSRYREGPVRLQDFRIERNGNGRDFDIIPSLSPGYGHGYTLRFDLLGPGPGEGAVPVASSGFYLRGGENIRLFVTLAEIRKRFPAFDLRRPYQVRGALILDAGHGGQSGMWSDAFIERVFPVAARSQFLVKEVLFQPTGLD